MTLKHFSETGERGRKIWPPQWGVQKVKKGREHPNMRREELPRQATIDSALSFETNAAFY
jgi:hypothetical protein